LQAVLLARSAHSLGAGAARYTHRILFLLPWEEWWIQKRDPSDNYRTEQQREQHRRDCHEAERERWIADAPGERDATWAAED